MKIKLVGKPGRLEKRRDLIITTITHPDVPEIVGLPDAEPIKYTVFISERQWQRTVKALFKEKALIVVEGYCSYDAEIGSMAVYAFSIRGESPKKPSKRPSNQKNAKAPTVKQDVDNGIVAKEQDSAPTTDTQKRRTELENVAAIYRQKIADIQSKPEDQQFGLEMTIKLLQKIESEIESLNNDNHTA